MAPSSKKERGSQKDKNTKLPETVSLDEETQKTFENKMKKFRRNRTEVMTPGVVYVGNIPHGFFEPQMTHFFSQFGKVLKIRLSRSKKTGGSKGYAFIKFQCDEVAKIVADTMNNYLMFERLLKCKYMPEESQHPDLFKGAGRKFKWPKSHLIARERHNKQKQSATTKRFLKKHMKRAAALEKLGVKLEGSTLEQAVKEAKKIREANIDSNKPDETKANEFNTTKGDNLSMKQKEENQTPLPVTTPKTERKQSVGGLKTPVNTEPLTKRKQPGSVQKTPGTNTTEPLSKGKQVGKVQKTPGTATSTKDSLRKRNQMGSVQNTPVAINSQTEPGSKRKKSADVEKTHITTESTGKRKKSISNLTAIDDSSSLVTPKNKKIKAMDVKTEPPKRRKSLVPEKTVGSARKLKTPKSLNKPTTRSKRLSV